MLPSMLPISFFLFYLLLGGFSAYIATKKNRSPIGWFFAGMFFGIIGLIFLAILPKLPENPAESDSGFMVNEEPPTKTQTLSSENSATDLTQSPKGTEKWFYLNKERQNVGPITLEDLLSFLRDKERHAKDKTSPEEIWVWKQGMENWEKVKNVEDLKEALKILI